MKLSVEANHQLKNVQRSYIREILSAAKSSKVLSLAGGLPANEFMPVTLFMQAMATLSATPEVFQYGETQGYQPLLEFIEDNYHLSAQTSSIVCNGSQQGLDLIARAYINPGDIVVMEAPSYLGALQVFSLAQAEVVSVEQNKQGPNLQQLELLFTTNVVKFFYAVPDFHNPTGVCWSLQTRQKVANLCQQYDVVLIEDAPYREIRFSGKKLPLVASFCIDQAMVLRSFSKVAAPGVRLGIISAHSNLMAPILKVKQTADLHTGVPMQAALLHVLQNPGFGYHLECVRKNYAVRYQALANSLSGLNEHECSFDVVEGGMFVWLKLPDIDAMSLAKKLIEKKVAVVPGEVFYPSGQQHESALRLNFSHSSPDELEKAVSIMAKVIRKIG